MSALQIVGLCLLVTAFAFSLGWMLGHAAALEDQPPPAVRWQDVVGNDPTRLWASHRRPGSGITYMQARTDSDALALWAKVSVEHRPESVNDALAERRER